MLRIVYIFLCLSSCIWASPQPNEIRALQNQVDYFNKQHFNERIAALEKTIGQLENTVEELSFKIKKIASSEQTTHAKTSPHTPTDVTPKKPGLVDAQTLYHLALSKIKATHRNDALKHLDQLIQQHPTSKWTPLAYYWKGEIYLQQNKNPEAQKALSIVVNKYKNASKYPDAVLKLASIYMQQNNILQARALLEALIKNQSTSPIAIKAKEILKKLPSQ